MLKELTIVNFAIIDKLEITFNKGLTVITGETGAGKSIILDAISFLFGARSSADLIKNGEQKAIVEGIFEVNKDLFEKLKPWFNENELDCSSNTIQLSRELSSSGSKARINGSLVNVSHLAFLSSYLIDRHEQSEHLGLLNEEKQLEILDSFGNETHKSLVGNFKTEYSEYIATRNKFEKIKIQSGDKEKKIELLEFQISEIKNAQIKDPLEEEILLERRKKLLHKKELIENASSVIELLNGNEDHPSALSSLSQIKKVLSNTSKFDNRFSKYATDTEESINSLKDLSEFLSNYLDTISTSDNNLEEIEDRLDLFYKLKKKYGDSLEEISISYNNYIKELNNLKHGELSLESIKNEFEQKEKSVNIFGGKLTKSRTTLGEIYSKKIKDELLTLGFKNVNFQIRIQKDILTEAGFDKAAFLFTSNPDEPLKEIEKVVSGGELSRIMLAIKSLSTVSGNNPLIIFDEIDSGVSGEVALSIAHKLYKISLSNQLLCITHQPIIAAMADEHLLITKEYVENKTIVKVKKVKQDEKESALAMLLSGDNNTNEISLNAKKYAKSLIENAEKIKM